MAQPNETAIIQTLDKEYKLVADWAAKHGIEIINGNPPSADTTLDAAKIVKRNEIARAAQEYIAAGAKVGDNAYPATGVEADHILRCAVEAQLDSDNSSTFKVKTISGNLVELNSVGLKNVIREINNVVSFALARQEECARLVDEAMDISALQSIVFTIVR